MIKGRTVPQLQQFEQFAVNMLGTRDVQWLPLYDSALYAAAGQQQLNFFQLQQGQGATSQPGAAGTKGIGDTNMTLSGQIAAPQQFMAVGIELQFPEGLRALALFRHAEGEIPDTLEDFELTGRTLAHVAVVR